MYIWFVFGLMCFSPFAMADEVSICYNYDCAVTAKVDFLAVELGAIRQVLLRRIDAAGERQAISQVLGLFEIAAGKQTPTWADKGRNVNDDEVNGRMDCIDESRNATTYLRLLESKGWLKFHRVLDPVIRAPLLLDDHWAARIVENKTGLEYAVDSWFLDNGQPAFVAPLDEWRHGAEPNEE